jgi:3D (Asp-Asp-Asp) domain-containing protein
LFQNGWVFGKKVYIEGLGIFTIADLMNKRWKKRIDVLMLDEKQAFKFGHQSKTVALLDL